MIESSLMLLDDATAYAEREGFEVVIKGDRLVVRKYKRDVGSTIITDGLVARHGMKRITGNLGQNKT